jgi:hypothetical protein
MLLPLVVRMIMNGLSTVADMLLDIFLVSLDFIFVLLVQNLHAELDITEQLITSGLGEVLTNDHSQHLQVICVGSHGVCRHDPAAGTQLMSKCEFVVVFFEFRVQAESDEGETGSVLLGHDYKAELFQRLGEVVCGSREVRHDRTVTVFAKADQLIVLTNDLRGSLGEVEGERCLISSEVVDVEDKFFGEIFGFSPDDPTYTWVDETVPLQVSM